MFARLLQVENAEAVPDNDDWIEGYVAHHGDAGLRAIDRLLAQSATDLHEAQSERDFPIS